MRGLPLWEGCSAARQEAQALAEAIRQTSTTRDVFRIRPAAKSWEITTAGRSWTIIPVAPDGNQPTALFAATFQPCSGSIASPESCQAASDCGAGCN
jgi:hypothetical protein